MSVMIKSKSRKEPSFRQLFNYITRDGDASQTLLVHNVYGKTHSEIIKKFENNADLMGKIKGGNFLYHEILALPKLESVPHEQQEIALLDIARTYLKKRAASQLAIGAVHFDKDHIHLHLMISANNFLEKKRVRVEKSKFSTIQREIEDYQILKYPNLGDKRIYNKTEKVLEAAIRMTDKEFQFKKRTGHRLEKQEVRILAQTCLLGAGTKKQFCDLLTQNNLELYQSRGAYGLINHKTGRKHRFKTLGLKEEFENKIQAFAQYEKNLKIIEEIKKSNQRQKNNEKKGGRVTGLNSND